MPKVKKPRLVLFFCLQVAYLKVVRAFFLLLALATLTSAAEPIRVDPENSRYFLFRGCGQAAGLRRFAGHHRRRVGRRRAGMPYSLDFIIADETLRLKSGGQGPSVRAPAKSPANLSFCPFPKGRSHWHGEES